MADLWVRSEIAVVHIFCLMLQSSTSSAWCYSRPHLLPDVTVVHIFCLMLQSSIFCLVLVVHIFCLVLQSSTSSARCYSCPHLLPGVIVVHIFRLVLQSSTSSDWFSLLPFFLLIFSFS
ncbi:hypothetical protein STEG23_015313 [Scotinomys teguina]